MRLSPNHPTGTAYPVGVFRAASRWVVEHPRLITLPVVLLVGALCVRQW